MQKEQFSRVRSKLGKATPSSTKYRIIPSTDTNDFISAMIVGLTGKTTEELGLKGTKMFIDVKEKRAHIVSVFRTENVRQIQNVAGAKRVAFPDIEKLRGVFFIDSPELFDEDDKTVSFRWHTNTLTCALLNISLLSKGLTFEYDGVSGKDKKKGEVKKVLPVIITVEVKGTDPEPYNPEEIDEWISSIKAKSDK